MDTQKDNMKKQKALRHALTICANVKNEQTELQTRLADTEQAAFQATEVRLVPDVYSCLCPTKTCVVGKEATEHPVRDEEPGT